jgi:hypothetical protein
MELCEAPVDSAPISPVIFDLCAVLRHLNTAAATISVPAKPLLHPAW